MDRRVQEDGTVIVGGQVVPVGGSQPTIASVVSYSGNAGLQSTNVEGALDELDNEKAPNTHTHDDRYFTEVEVTNLLAGKAATSHNHDDRYFTEVEVTDLLAGKSPVGHIHDDRYYTETEVDEKLATILASADLHENSKFDLVQWDTGGPGTQGTIPGRLLPVGWGDFWSNATNGVYPELSADNTERVDNQGYSFKVVHAQDTGQSLDGSVFAVSAGSVVTASVWVKGTNGPRAFLTLLTSLPTADPSYFQPAGSTAGVDTNSFEPGPTWTKLTASVVVPSGHTKARIMLRSYADTSNGATAGTIWWDDSSTSMQVIPPSDVITGEIKMWPSATAPAGYLKCDGATFSSTTYPALAALLGDTFGTHSGTTYYLPDFRGRSPAGVGPVTPAQTGNYSFALGQKYGTSMHTLTVAQQPSVTGQIQAHSSFSHWWAPSGAFSTSAMYGGYAAPNLTSTGANSVQHLNFNNGGQNAAHENTHPILGINFIIKAA